MHFSNIIITALLALTTAAGVIHDDHPDPNNTGATSNNAASAVLGKRAISKKPTPCQEALVEMAKKGVPKSFTIAKLPAKWDPKKAAAAKEKEDDNNPKDPKKPKSRRGLEKREVFEVGMRQTMIGTNHDGLTTRGLGTCFCVAVTLNDQHTGNANKILSHLSPSGGQMQIDHLYQAVINAILVANYPSHVYRMSLPDMHSQIQDMVQNGMIDQDQAGDMLIALENIENTFTRAVGGIAAQTGGATATRRRAPGMLGSPYGELSIQPDNTVIHEGWAWQ